MINRQKYNSEILNKLQDFLKEHPDFRFIQALWALNIVYREDRFYEEPDKTLDKVSKTLAGLKAGKKINIFHENSIQQMAFLYDSFVAVGKLTGKEYTCFLDNMSESMAKYHFLTEQKKDFWEKMNNYN